MDSIDLSGIDGSFLDAFLDDVEEDGGARTSMRGSPVPFLPKAVAQTQKSSKKDPGTLSHHFKYGELIGKGAIGKVYRALDVDKGNFVAIKVMDKESKSSFFFPCP